MQALPDALQPRRIMYHALLPLPPAGTVAQRPLRGQMLRAILGIDPAEATFARRGFAGGAEARARLEGVGWAFLDGYHAALEAGTPGALEAALEGVPPAMRGFAYEGAGMALALLDALTPWRRTRLRALLEGPGAPYVYMVNVGAGWARARLRRPLDRVPDGMDPLLGWLAADGYGFHEGYFNPRVTVDACAVPARVTGYGRRAFDQGVGRSLWFVHGADAGRVAAAVRRFSPARQADVWSGVGLACAYAGGADAQGAEALAWVGERAALAQGAAFAARARQRAGNPAAHTDAACQVLCGVSADAAAAVAEDAMKDLPPDGAVPAYEAWRQRIQRHFAREVAA